MSLPAAHDAASLPRRIACGDRQALADLCERYQAPLCRYLAHFTADRGVVEELLQDTLVAVWKNAGSFGGRGSVQAWLFGIARRRALKHLRRRDPDLAALDEADAIASPEPEPEAALLARITRAEVAEAVERLGAIHREALLLAFAYELSYEEMAAVLDIPLGTVKSRLSNAKRALRALLPPLEENAR